jgi:hypothetical protein
LPLRNDKKKRVRKCRGKYYRMTSKTNIYETLNDEEDNSNMSGS